MFWHFEPEKAGFTEEEWDRVPRRDRVLIKSYHLNGGDIDQTFLFCEYETQRQVRLTEKRYELEHRPLIQLSYSDFHFA